MKKYRQERYSYECDALELPARGFAFAPLVFPGRVARS